MSIRYVTLFLVAAITSACNKPSTESPAGSAEKSTQTASDAKDLIDWTKYFEIDASDVLLTESGKAGNKDTGDWEVCHKVDHNAHPGGSGVHLKKGQKVSMEKGSGDELILKFEADKAYAVNLVKSPNGSYAGALPITHMDNGVEKSVFHIVRFQKVKAISNFENCKKGAVTLDIQLCWLDDDGLQCNDRNGDGGHAHAQMP